MRIDILTLFPEMFDGPFSQSIVSRAVKKGIVEIHLHDIRDYATGKHKNVDDYSYGGDPGMVMMIQPIDDCIKHLQQQRKYDELIYLSPDGELLDQPIANQLSASQNIILLCGHYKGIDQRIREFLVTREISIGNYVLSGGELAAAVLTDALVRLIPGVLNDEMSALSDSFQDGMVSPPAYTRPADYKGWKVPEILLSGNGKEIRKWQMNQAIKLTRAKRPEFLDDDS